VVEVRHAPRLIATNFGVPEKVFEDMPGDAVIMPEED